MWKKPCRELEEEREEEFSNKYVLNCVKQEGLASGKKTCLSGFTVEAIWKVEMLKDTVCWRKRITKAD